MPKDITRNYMRLASRIAGDPQQEKERRAVRRKRTYHFKQEVLERDGHQCLVCGYTEFVEIHHIIRVSHDGDSFPENLVTLCPNHHRLADRGRISAETLRKLVLARYEESLDGVLPTMDTSRLAIR